MSSKVVSGSRAAEAVPFDWGRPAPCPSGRPAQARLPGPSGQAADGGELEARLAELERQAAGARQEGFRDGEAAGFQRAAANLEPLMDRLARTVEEIAALRTRIRREAEADLVKLALAIARRILYREVHSDPEALLGLVKAALDKLDAREVQRLRLHPQDAAVVEGRLKRDRLPAHFEVTPDAGLERGAAVFETARGTFDASMETQLEEIGRGLADRMVRRA